MRKRMSPVTKMKIQNIIIYLAAIVFCILWLSDVIAINKRIKQDEMKILEYAQSTASSLQLYVENGGEGTWYNGAEYMMRFDTLYAQYIEVRCSQKAFSKRKPTEAERSAYEYAHFVARRMISDPETMKLYAVDLAWAMRQFGNRDPFSNENMKFIADKLAEICAATEPE